MYETALVVHNVLRWAAIAAVTYAFLRAASGWMSGRVRDRGDKVSELLATIAVDVQLVLGFLLYFLWSPNVASARQDMGAAMKDPVLRFWAVEHVTVMVLAIVIVHVGKILSRRAKTENSKHRRAAIAFGIALALMLVGTPWPGGKLDRPLLRM